MSNCLYVVDLQNYIQNTFHWPLIANLMLTRVAFSRFAKANQALRSLCFFTRSYRVSKHSRQKNHSEGFFLEIWITLRNALGRPLDWPGQPNSPRKSNQMDDLTCFKTAAADNRLFWGHNSVFIFGFNEAPNNEKYNFGGNF